MAKVNIKSEKITPFGGIYYANKAFYALSLDKVINGTLGVRSSTYNGYQWDEIMSAMSDVFLCGGDCVEDVNRSECHLRESPVKQKAQPPLLLFYFFTLLLFNTFSFLPSRLYPDFCIL
ncbi:hypothetical protein [Prevotella merdae]|uniref:hypothetical protein n=1 Tax=Prevotella merdae TaxID=2079531 RepID=UPI00356890B4